MPATLSTTINYSGMLSAKTDESTRGLDAVYSRGKNGGATTVYSLEFALSSGFQLLPPTQPNISETASLTAPAPETTERTQEYNVIQIFQRAVDVSYLKQSNRDLLGGVNVAGQANNVPNELDFQIGMRIAQMRKDLNFTMWNGVYQYTKGSTTVAPRTRGLILAIQTNRFNAAGDPVSQGLIDNALMNSIKNGANPMEFEIWVNPAMLMKLTDAFALIPGTNQPATRTEGGLAYSQLLTHFGPLNVMWDPDIAINQIIFANIGAMAIAQKPYFDENGNNLGVLFYEPLAKLGASERGQLYGELGVDYGAEWHHAMIYGIGA